MWILAIRDTGMFLLGSAIIIRELFSGHPDPVLIETGATLTGVPAWLHHRKLGRTESTPDSTPQQPHSHSPSSESPNSSLGGEV